MAAKVVFTNGCFDLLHAGHVRFLSEARSLGDRLVVGINTDDSVARLKSGRPIITLSDRMDMLMALRAVDEVIPFDDDTPYQLIRRVRPDVLVKGGAANIVGADLVRGWGGIVVHLAETGWHTTDIIERLNNARRSNSNHQRDDLAG